MTTWDCIVKRILELCQQRRWSVNHLCNECGVPPTTIKNILNGKSKNPGVVTIKMICDGLGITLMDFFNTDYFRELEQEIR